MSLVFLQGFRESRLWLRRRETVMFSLALPVLFLVFFGALYGNNRVPGTNIKYINYIVPGYAVYAVMAVAMGTVSANLAADRQYGILKRLGGTPLPRSFLIGAKIIAAAILIAAVLVVLIAVGIIGYHIQLRGNQLIALLVLIVGVLTFSAIGITLGGVVKSDAAVPAGSLLYLAFSFLGGVFVPLYQFPSGLRQVAQYLPSERMVHAMQSVWTQDKGFSSVEQDILVMLLWAAGAILVAIRRFRWE